MVYSLRPDLFVASLGIMIVRDARIASDKKNETEGVPLFEQKTKKNLASSDLCSSAYRLTRIR